MKSDSLSPLPGLLGDENVHRDAVAIALNASKAVLWAWDLETDELHWAPQTAALLGVKEIGRNVEAFLELLHPEDVARGRTVFRRAMADGSAIHLEFRRAAPDGESAWFANYGKARYDKSGVARQFVGAILPLAAKPERMDFACLAEDPRFSNRDPVLSLLARLRAEVAAHLSSTDDIGRARVEEDILQLLLCRIVPPDVAKANAAALMERFGALSTMFQSPPALVATVEGVDERHLLLFDLVRSSIQCVLRPTRAPMQFASEGAVVSYLRVAQAHKTREQLRVIFLDQSRHIICDEVMQEGTVDHAPVYVREVMKRALELSASSIILAHNHPSGNLMPSFRDILMTQQIVEAAKMLGVGVDDHIILTRHGHTSMRALNMMGGAGPA